VLAGGFLILRHARGWGTGGAWMHRSEASPEVGVAPETQAG
jgi:hypothetical protein